jgi:hypothetical protein
VIIVRINYIHIVETCDLSNSGNDSEIFVRENDDLENPFIRRETILPIETYILVTSEMLQ